MIEIQYKIDLKKDDKSFVRTSGKDVTKGEVGDLLVFLEQLKLDLISKEFDVGKGGFEIHQDI